MTKIEYQDGTTEEYGYDEMKNMSGRIKMDNFISFLNKSENLRKGYINSLEKADVNFKKKWLKCFSYIPYFFEEIYSVCNGTKREIKEQAFFDLVPGYRLMQIDEILDIYLKEFKINKKYDNIIPFLEDYSSCYYAYATNKNKESIVLVEDGKIEIIHSEISKFWQTIIAFYDEQVYFLDEDGFLSYDYVKEGKVGEKYNADIKYWKE